MARKEFSVATRVAAAKRSGCLCERHLWREGEVCRRPAREFDHLNPDGEGGPPTLENCAHLCATCHGEKTATEDVPRMAAADLSRKRLVYGVKPERGQKLQSRGFQKVAKPRAFEAGRAFPPRRSLFTPEEPGGRPGPSLAISGETEADGEAHGHDADRDGEAG